MTDRDTVVEVVADVALAVDVPTEHGGDLPAGVRAVLDDVAAVRDVVVEEIGDVDSGNGMLRVHFEGQVTLHFAEPVDDAEAASRRLADADPVAAVRWFDAVAGPYEIERW